jgi:hypothetical protein
MILDSNPHRNLWMFVKKDLSHCKHSRNNRAKTNETLNENLIEQEKDAVNYNFIQVGSHCCFA